MKILLSALLSALTFSVFATEKTIDFSFRDVEVTDAIKKYASASGQKFIVDPMVRGKITVMNPGPVTISEAFNQLSSALALSGLAISHQDDNFIVNSARNTQRSLIEVSSELPALKPERMYTWVINLKNVKAEDVNKQLRILPSKDGELVAFQPRNQILVTDWVSNLHRIAKIVGEVDKPAEKPTAKK